MLGEEAANGNAVACGLSVKVESFKFVVYTCVMLDILPIFSILSKSFPVRQPGLRQDELSDVCDEENHESVHKTTISKLFATMSDHSSVNKTFNGDLRKHRHVLLTLVVIFYICIVMHIVMKAWDIIEMDFDEITFADDADAYADLNTLHHVSNEMTPADRPVAEKETPT